MAEAPEHLDIREQLAHIDQMLADAARTHQQITYQPWIFMVSGMTAGAALFAAGAAFFKILT
ncbi:MAG TPA: hypothetical protein VGL83_01010 [Stellaceae bacterium]|jgi:hypothetical protein